MTSTHPGPFTHRNWRAFEEGGEQPKATCEWPVFSDAHFSGTLGSLGPYEVVGAGLWTFSGRQAKAAFVLRGKVFIEEYGSGNLKDIYHGAPHQQELVALMSLCWGVRLRAGSISRWFSENSDPLGVPLGTGGGVDFSAPEAPVLPRAVRTAANPVRWGDPEFIRLLRGFEMLDGKTAGVLVTAARLYQDALWLAEVEPHIAWIFLVSAAEAVADHWRSGSRDHVDRLNDVYPDVVTALRDAGGEELVRRVAVRLADVTGAARKFCDFLMHFDPGPPLGARMLEIDWTKLRDALKVIYRWRSRALHRGTPFPSPMCEPPFINGGAISIEHSEPGAISEGVMGLAAGSGGAMWENRETPMLLHVFEHLTRGALLRWWNGALIDP